MPPSDDRTRSAGSFYWKPSATVGILVVCLGSLSGCASHPTHPTHPSRPFQPALSEDIRSHLGTVGVTGTDTIPEVGFVLPAKGWTEGLGRGMDKGLEIDRDLADPRNLGGVVSAIVLAPIFALAGGAYGAIVAEPASNVEEANRLLRQAISELNLQESLRERTVQVGRLETDIPYVVLPAESSVNARAMDSLPVNTILVVQITYVTLEDGKGSVNPALRLVLKAQAQLIRKTDGNTLYVLSSEFRGMRHTFREWAAEEGKLFRSELDRGLQDIAVHIIEGTFMLYLFATPEGGLRPDYPPGRDCSQIDSLQPRVQWEPFPRETDRLNDSQGTFARISDISYDIGIWKADEEFDTGDSPRKLVYVRRHLPTPVHRIEEPLMASRLYFWSIRARFSVDGHPRVTEWSYQSYLSGKISSFCFRTPATSPTSLSIRP